MPAVPYLRAIAVTLFNVLKNGGGKVNCVIDSSCKVRGIFHVQETLVSGFHGLLVQPVDPHPQVGVGLTI